MVVRHVLRNAMLPVVTMVGLMLPGYGRARRDRGDGVPASRPGEPLGVRHRTARFDYIVVSGINLVVAGFVLIVNLLIDLTYSFLDPRIRYD